MSLMDRVCRQQAVYWPCLYQDKNGKPFPGIPVQIICRWVIVQKQLLDKEGNPFVSNASVMVRQVLTVNGYLWLSALDASTNPDLLVDPVVPALPSATETCFEIRKFLTLPDIRNRNIFMEAVI